MRDGRKCLRKSYAFFTQSLRILYAIFTQKRPECVVWCYRGAASKGAALSYPMEGALRIRTLELV